MSDKPKPTLREDPAFRPEPFPAFRRRLEERRAQLRREDKEEAERRAATPPPRQTRRMDGGNPGVEGA